MNAPSTSDERIVDIVDDGGRSSARALTAGSVIGLAATALVSAGAGFDFAVVCLAPALVAASVAAVVDVRSGHLPDRWVAAVALSGLGTAVLVGGSGGAWEWASGAAITLVAMLLFHLAAPCAMGFGDVKYAAALGGLLGLVGDDLEQRALAVSVALMIASAAAIVSGALVRRFALAFGPWLLFGTVVTLSGAGALGSGIAS